MAQVALYLKRSLDHPLHIKICIPELVGNRSDVKSIQEILHSSIARWCSLYLYIDCIDPYLRYLSTCPGAPQLESIRLYDLPGSADFVMDGVHDLFSGVTPNLTSVSIGGPITLPWRCHVFQGLTVLNLRFMKDEDATWQPSLPDLVAMLRCCPKIAALRLADYYPPRLLENEQPVHLQYLQDLVVENCHPASMEILLPLIDAPCLKHLSLDFSKIGEIYVDAQNLGIILRDRPFLTTLTSLRLAPFPNCWAILPQLHNLRSICINSGLIYNDMSGFAVKLAGPSTRRIYCPRLANVFLRGTKYHAEDKMWITNLISLVRGRASHHDARLNAVYIDQIDRLPEDKKKQIEEWLDGSVLGFDGFQMPETDHLRWLLPNAPRFQSRYWRTGAQ